MPKYYENICEYVFRNGSRKGEVCGKASKENLCAFHKKNTLDKKKEYYDKHKKLNEGVYQHLIDRVKNHMKVNYNVKKENYEIKLRVIENELSYFIKQKKGILLALNKITEDEIILDNKPMITLIIKLFKHYNKYHDLFTMQSVYQREFNKLDYKIIKLEEQNGDKDEIKYLKNKSYKLQKKSDKYDEDNKLNIEDIELLTEIIVTKEDLNNEKLKKEAFDKYNEENKYESYILRLNEDDINYYNNIIKKNIYIPTSKKVKDSDLKNLESKILHHKRLILTYNEIIKLFN
jgi:hypothetical protein